MNGSLLEEIERVRAAQIETEKNVAITTKLLELIDEFKLDMPEKRVKLIDMRDAQKLRHLAYQQRINELADRL